MLKKDGQLLLAVTKRLLCLLSCSFGLLLPSLAPSSPFLVVLRRSNVRVSEDGGMGWKSVCGCGGGCVEDV